jgi:hypothetical protein
MLPDLLNENVATAAIAIKVAIITFFIKSSDLHDNYCQIDANFYPKKLKNSTKLTAQNFKRFQIKFFGANPHRRAAV